MAGSEDAVSCDTERTREEGAGAPARHDARALGRGAVLAGKYRLELQLGSGGMAVVWSAYHLELEQPVAVKLLRGGYDPGLARRLRREARAAARLVHPSIVRVFDIAATDEGTPFVVMELLTGETLAQLVARERVSALYLVQLLLPIIEGLAMAHARGVIHRDLKPDNVFLAVEGERLQPKLLDFGIAKLSGGAPFLTKLTGRGVVLGCPSYMSPEQARGDEIDFSSDIWSLCVLLYKVIGGKLPFRGEGTQAIFNAILGSEPAALPLGAGVDGHLARIVLSGLSKNPAARPASMRQLGQQLARWLLLHGVAVDVCGTPLVSRWLTSEPPAALPASVAPPTTKRLPPPPSGAPSSLLPTARSDRPRVVVAASPRRPAVRRLQRTLAHFFAAKQRRWLLWAIAGMLVAGASLAVGKSGGLRQGASTPSHPAVDAQPRRALASNDAETLTTTTTDLPAEPALVIANPAPASQPPTSSAPALTAQHAKGSSRPPRVRLPF
jgi:serine/threonine protein kinase